jgi:SAM-dependent methyltransferase
MRVLLRRILDFLGLSYWVREIISGAKYVMDAGVRARNREYSLKGAADGFAFPGPRLIYLVTGQFEIEGFIANGAVGKESITKTLAKNGFKMEDFKTVLDFGCGCGRVMRHWGRVSGPKFFGTDFNPRAIDWCKRSLTFAEFHNNGASSRLNFADESFDFIYAISVFTHFPEDLQRFWIDELYRVSKPGGILYLTTCGRSFESKLTASERVRFDRGDMILVGARFAGENVCVAYHPEKYVREVLASRFEVLDFIPLGAHDADQDIVLLRKPLRS